jgi:putative transcriptional regulator
MELTSNLRNHFLVALHGETDPLFHHSVIYVCDHNAQGALGLLLNKPTGIHLTDIFQSLEIKVANPHLAKMPVFTGGPVQEEVGMVLHNGDVTWQSSVPTSATLNVTTSRDILFAMAEQKGPEKTFFSLGYSGWSAGQLEDEVARDFWLVCPAQDKIIFEVPIAQRWEAAIRSMGIEPSQLVTQHGNV